jgi:ribosome-associated translation inhibitor RaiA
MSVLLNPELKVLSDADSEIASDAVSDTVLDAARSAMEDTPEVKSYIYQQISEFEPFITPETVVSVISKDPKKLVRRYELDETEFDYEDLRTQYRISISLKEGDAKLIAEGLDKDIFTAVRKAKESLMKKLMKIQDSVVTQQERNMAVYQALQNTMIH